MEIGPPASLGPSALTVLARRYLRAGETPAQRFDQVAAAIAGVEAGFGVPPAEIAAWTERFAARMKALEFLPNSPTLMNAGRPLGQLAACFVVPVEDSSRDIFAALGWAAEIQKSGGGTGFAFSRLRPAGDPVESTGGVASGPVAFMQVFDAATEAIKQGGTRRGANMGILRVDHPDILEFIALKLDPTRMRNFNLSVAATDEFMAAVHAGAPYALRHPRTGAVVRTLDARHVFELIGNAAWTCGDPGLVFIDRIDGDNPTPGRGPIEATNPCGEQPLLPFEACTLGSIDLGKFADPGRATVAWDSLRGAIHDGVRFLDDVVEANRYPLPQIEAATRATRKIGLGVMGLADLFIELGVPYDDPRALDLAGEVAGFLERESIAASAELAAARGPFPAFPGSRWDVPGQPPLRNATTTTVAPTGTISIIAGCSSGIEPLYAVAYQRHVLDGEVLPELHPAFARRAAAAGVLDEDLIAQVRARGRVRGLARVPAALQALFATAHDVPVDHHVRMQAVFQRHVHAAVSKTINLPHDATPIDVRRAYELAYQLGCKGITIYRDGSRATQVLAYGEAAPRDAGADPCPECGGTLTRTAGCRACTRCGWSVCG